MAVVSQGEINAARDGVESWDTGAELTKSDYSRVFLVTDDAGTATEDQIKQAPGVIIGSPHPVNADATCRDIRYREVNSGGNYWTYEVTAFYQSRERDKGKPLVWDYSGETRFVTTPADKGDGAGGTPILHANDAGQLFDVETAEIIILFRARLTFDAGSFNAPTYLKQYMGKVNSDAFQGADPFELLCADIRIKPDDDERFWVINWLFKYWPRDANAQTGSKGWQYDLLNTSTASRENAGENFKYHFLDSEGNVTYDKSAAVAPVELFILTDRDAPNTGMLSGNNGKDVQYKGPFNRYEPTAFANIFAP